MQSDVSMFSFEGTSSKKPIKAGFDRRGKTNEMDEPWAKDRGEGYGICFDELVLIGVWVHLFPSRTQKLSTLSPTILAG